MNEINKIKLTLIGTRFSPHKKPGGGLNTLEENIQYLGYIRLFPVQEVLESTDDCVL